SAGAGVPPVRIHIAGVCVASRNVAKVSSDFRHIAGVCVMSRSVAKSSSAFRFRADDTWGASPWQSRSSPGKQAKCYLYEVAFLC
ncbi:hypothetical protein, partial [Desulfosporosinus sp. OT]|uniref:hypothetical protein n=1 Tax=Desulfosporosinus sp. OT TaxID=913865 RepID=UPI001A99370E